MVCGVGSMYTPAEREVEKDLGEILDITLKLQDAGKGEPEIQPDSEKKPEHNSEGSLNKSA